MRTPGISTEQGPPLAIPLSFFFTAPFAVAAAGALLLSDGSSLLLTGFAPRTLLLTHLGTLGFLGMVMFGAMTQMAPVVASAPLRPVRLSYAVYAMLTVGLIALALAVLGVIPMRIGFHSGFGFIELATIVFLAQAGTALARTRAQNDTVTGMRFAIVSLALVVVIGTALELAYRGTFTVVDRLLWIRVHLFVALVGWVGGLIAAVAWQVLPMFYLAAVLPARRRNLVMGLVNASVFSTVLALALKVAVPEFPAGWMTAATMAPAAAALWVVQPAWLLKGLNRRRRARGDVSLLFWKTALAISPVVAITAAWATLSPDPRPKILFVFLAVWGWAGLIVHGMLSRIVPFLVWLHRFSFLIGRVRVPAARALLPEGWVRATFVTHVFTLVVGVVAIWTRWDWAARATGVGLLITAGLVFGWLLRVAMRRPDSAAAETEASTAAG